MTAATDGACDRCGGVTGLEQVDVTEGSTVTHIHLCNRCRNLAQVEWCAFCGMGLIAKFRAGELLMDDADGPLAICKTCRSALLDDLQVPPDERTTVADGGRR